MRVNLWKWSTRCIALIVAASLCGGCTVAGMVRQVLQQAAGGSSPSGDTAYVGTLTSTDDGPRDSGPGIIVVEPVAAGASGELAAFGAGCARWLNLHTGGHGEFGQTPVWGQIDDVRHDLKRTDLRFEAEDVETLAELTGATHIAIGKIKANGPQITLTYQLHQAYPEKKAVGEPLSVSGTREQITEALPATASSLAKKLGLSTPRVPKIQIQAAELTTLGQAPWKARTPVSAVVAARLVALSAREPLAGVLFLRSETIRDNDDARLPLVTKRLMQQAPGNLLVVGDIARFYPAQMDAYSAVLSRHRQQFPDAFLPAMAMVEWEVAQERYPQSRSAAEDGVRIAPRNPLAWLDLADSLFDEAQAIRQSRYSNEMSAQEWQALHRIYPKWLAAAQHATEMTPQDSDAWSELAVAATFNSNMTLADKALWQAYDLDPSNSRIYTWGLQLYQPKWNGDKEKLLKVARLATEHAPPHEFPYYFGNVVKSELPEHKDELFKAALKRVPDNAMMNYYVGMTYHYEASIPDYATAEKYYRAALKADPKYGRCLSSLGDLYYFVHNDPKNAELLYRRAIASEPKSGHNYANLARLLENTGRAEEAAIEAQKAAQLGARSDHPGLS